MEIEGRWKPSPEMEKAWQKRDAEAFKLGTIEERLDLPPTPEMREAWKKREEEDFMRGTEVKTEAEPTSKRLEAWGIQKKDNWKPSPEMEEAWRKREVEALLRD